MTSKKWKTGPMDKKTLDLLDFPRIREIIAALALSPDGQALIETQGFFSEQVSLKGFLDLVDEFKQRLEKGDLMPGLNFPEISRFFPRLEKQGALLEGRELSDFSEYIISSKTFKKYIEADKSFQNLNREAEKIPDLTSAALYIRKYLDIDGIVKEQEVPELKSIRKALSRLQGEMEKITAAYLKDSPSLFQTDLPTQRDGRIVLPLKANYKGKLKGIIHNTSASGSTLYIEPIELLEKNNEAALLENKYKQEIIKILRKCTEELREILPDLVFLIETVSYLDSVYARSMFSLKIRGSRALLKPEEMFLDKARHPLLGEQAVPVTIKLKKEKRMMIITGPNTGGKTVSLKTAGLLSLINQFGSHIPAEEGSVLPLFSGIFADIGDDQSIDQSLSTFSGHMRRISFIINNSNEQSLVLLDELGGGTDPEEGAALGMAVLDYFLNSGAFIITTTHNGAMKSYGFSKNGAFNASVAFDTATLSPTYVLNADLPGESHALDIAGRNGIPEVIMKQAVSNLEKGKSSLGELIRDLSKQLQNAHSKNEELKKKEAELAEFSRNQELFNLRLKQKEKILREQGCRDLDKFLSESRKKLENLVKDLREGELTRDKTKGVKEYLDTVAEKSAEEKVKIDVIDNAAGSEKEDYYESIPSMELEPGTEVLVGRDKRRGTLVRRSKKNQWIVAVESVKLAVSAGEIIPIKTAKVLKPAIVYSEAGFSGSPSFELDVRGKRLEETLFLVGKHIDRALLSGLIEFHIIHGTGEGILQKGIHEYLRNHASVADYFFSHPDSGGFGKTVVMLDKK